MYRSGDKSKAENRQRTYPAEKVRQGDIVLRKPWERVVFLAGLIVPCVLLLVWFVVRLATS
jgi:hypothetical protein